MKPFKLILVGLVLALMLSADSVYARRTMVKELKDDNWKDMLKGEWMIEFFSPTCQACQTISPIWDKFAYSQRDGSVQVAKVDVTKAPALGGRFLVNSLPTIYHVKNGEFRHYKGGRENDLFSKFVKNNQWKDVKPVAFYRKPTAPHMGTIATFFRMSQSLKDLNNRLVSTGIPAWFAFLLIGTGALVIGAAIGMIIVVLMDLVLPLRRSTELVDQTCPQQVEESIPTTQIVAPKPVEKTRPKDAKIFGLTSAVPEGPSVSNPARGEEKVCKTPAASKLDEKNKKLSETKKAFAETAPEPRKRKFSRTPTTRKTSQT